MMATTDHQQQKTFSGNLFGFILASKLLQV